MRNLKKFLALVLAMMMTLSLMITVNAATTSNKDFTDSNDVEIAFEEDIIVLSGMGVVEGHDTGEFRPKDNITRAQMAAIIYRIATGDVSDNREVYGSGYASFTDVPEDAWYAGYLGYCVNAGYIVGYPNGTFQPKKNVTGYEALVMILRAMGYNHEGNNFKGADWATLALSTATERGMLKNIIKTSYNNKYSQPAKRELVAEMAFQGVTIPMVRWTNGTYERYGIEGGMLSSILNPTLGELYFGLTNNQGIVVGNEATGEGDNVTKIGFGLDSKAVMSWTGFQVDETAGTVTGVAAQQTALNTLINDEVTDGTQAYVYDTDSGVTEPENVTLTFKWDSHLDDFGHAVDVWYDSRSTQKETVTATNGVKVDFPTNLNTYAVFDRVNEEATRVVAAPDADLATANNNATPNESLGEVLGYTTADANNVRNVYWNYAFGPTQAANYSNDGSYPAGDGSVDFTSPVLATDSTTSHGLYLVVSNNAAGTPDLIVSLNMTITKVVQDNDTTAPLSTGVLTQNASNNGTTNQDYFDLHDQVTPSTMSINSSITPYAYSNVANGNLLDSDDIALRDYVAAVTITGTNGDGVGGVSTGAEDNNTSPTTGDVDFGNATPADVSGAPGTADNSTYFYQMKKLSHPTTGNAWKYDRVTQDVTLEDGRTLHQSVFAKAVDASFLADLIGVKDPSNPTADEIAEVQAHINAPTATGAYTFWCDENGDYMFWTVANEQSATFVYGTYIDWETRTSTGLFNYPMSYVDSQGNGGKLVDVTHVYDENIGTTHAGSFPGAIIGTTGTPNGGDMDNDMYTEEIQLPKRTVMIDGGSAGYVRGTYVGYLLGDNGNLVAVTSDDNASGFVQATSNNYDFGHTDLTITATDVAVGAMPVGVDSNVSHLFLTNDTKFIIVNGAGMDANGNGTQTVKNFTGLDELVKEYGAGMKINSNSGFTGDSYLNDSKDTGTEFAPWEMIYYTSRTFDYSQTYDPSAKAVETVFIPEQLIDKGPEEDATSKEVVFVGDNTPGMINTTGDGWATNFTVYGLDGAEKSVWIEGRWNDDATSDANIIATDATGENTFIKLKMTDKVTNYGDPVYQLDDLTSKEEGILIGYYLDDVDGTPARTKCTLGCADNAGTDTEDTYLPTTYSSQVAYITGRQDGDLYNVGSKPAKVVNLDTTTYIINNLTDLNNAGQLTSNTGIPVSCVVDAESTHVVETIFVNYPS